MRTLFCIICLLIITSCCNNKISGLSNSEIDKIESNDNYVPWWIK